ncbi:MAG: multiubiquitin domain-containing protein [Pseudorhodoplanes sp.]|nr:multiubiquitin domain-containing protein [Pseudorhodoplanes sp.]
MSNATHTGGQAQPAPHPAGFDIEIAGTDLQFRKAKLTDPVPTGRQVIEAAGFKQVEEYIVLQWLPGNMLEELRLDETCNLRERGVERFIVAKSDRTFRFEIDSQRQEWPAPTVTREVLLALAGQDPALFSVWQEFKDKKDVEIVAGKPAELTPAGTERFYTVTTKTTEG